MCVPGVRCTCTCTAPLTAVLGCTGRAMAMSAMGSSRAIAMGGTGAWRESSALRHSAINHHRHSPVTSHIDSACTHTWVGGVDTVAGTRGRAAERVASAGMRRAALRCGSWLLVRLLASSVSFALLLRGACARMDWSTSGVVPPRLTTVPTVAALARCTALCRRVSAAARRHHPVAALSSSSSSSSCRAVLFAP